MTLRNKLLSIFPQFLPEADPGEADPAALQEQAKVAEAVAMKARRLEEVRRCAGWQDVLDILEKRCVKTEHDLINYNGCDKEMIARLQYRARVRREDFELLQAEIAAVIDTAAAVTPPLSVPQFNPGTNY